MAPTDAAQIQRMVRTVLQQVSASSQRTETAGESVRPAAPVSSAPESEASRVIIPDTPTAAPQAEVAVDSVRVSETAHGRLADQVLRVLSEATGSAPAADAALSGDTPEGLSSETLDTVLSDPAIRRELVRAFSQPEVADRIPEFLRDPVLQEATVRLLARDEMAAVANRVLQSPETAETFARLVSQDTTREPALSLLLRADQPSVTREVVERLDAPETLARIAESPNGRAILARVASESPEAAARILDALNTNSSAVTTPREPSPAVHTLGRAELRAASADILRDPATARPYLDILATHPQGDELARSILASDAPREALASVLRGSEASDAALRLLERPALAPVAQEIANSPETKAFLRDALQAPADTPRDGTVRALFDLVARSSSPEIQSGLRTVLTEPDSAQALATRFEQSPAWRQTLLDAATRQPDETRQWLEQPAAREAVAHFIANADAGTTADRAAALRLFLSASASQPSSEPSPLAETLSTPDSRALLTQMLSRPETRLTAADALARPDTTETAVRIFASPEGTEALRALVAEPAAQNAAARLLSQPRTADTVLTQMTASASPEQIAQFVAQPAFGRALEGLLSLPGTARETLALLARAEFFPRAAEILDRPEVQTRAIEMLAQPETREAVTTILNSLSAPRLEQIASSPEFLQTALQATRAGGDEATAMLGILQRSAPDEAVARFLASPEWQAAAPELLNSETTRTLTLGLIARAPESTSVATVLQTPEGEAALRAALQAQPSGLAARAAPETNSALSILARPEMRETLTRLAADADFQTALGRLATRSETRADAFRLLQTPEMKPVVARLFSGRGGELLALDMAVRPGAGSTADEVLRSPEATQALLRALQRPENAQQAQRLFASEPVRAEATRILQSDSPARTSLLRILDSPAQTEAARRILLEPETLARLPEMVQMPESRPATMRILTRLAASDSGQTRQTLQPALSDSRSIEGFSQVFAGRAPSMADAASGSPINAALRILAWPGMGEAAAHVFDTPENREALVTVLSRAVQMADAPAGVARPNQTAPDVAQVLQLLERPELAGAAHRLLAAPEMRARLGDLLAGTATEGRIVSPENAQSILRILARPEMTDAAREVLSRDDVQQRLPSLLADTRTRDGALRLLLEPAFAETGRATFQTVGGRQALLELLASPDTGATTLSRILESPASSGTAARIITGLEGTEALNRLLSRPETQQALPNLLQDTEARPELLRVLSQPEHTAVAARLLEAPGTPQRISASIESQDTSASRWLEILAQPESQEAARAWLDQPRNAGRLRALIVDQPQMREAAFRLLAQPAAREAAPRVFSTPEAFGALTRAATGSPSTPDASASDVARSQSHALRILSQPRMADALRNVMSQTQNQATIAEAFSRNENRQALLAVLTEQRQRETARILTDRTDMRQAIVEVLRTETPQRLAQILSDNETAARILEAIENTDAESVQRILATEAGMREAARLLSDARTRRTLLRILATPTNSEAAARLLSRSDTQRAILPLLNTSEGRAWLANLASTAPRLTQEALTGLLTNARANPQVPAETVEWLTILTTQTQNAVRTASPNVPLSAMPGTLARLQGASGDEVVAAILGGTQATGARSPMSWVFDNLPMAVQRLFGPMGPAAQGGRPLASTATLRHLGDTAEHLHDVSPRRSERLMRALAVLSRLGGKNLDTVLEQITGRIENMTKQLAMKGGLPTGSSEPTLPQSSLLMIRLPSLPSTQLVAVARALTEQGVEVAFVGRGATGDAQIQVQLAELPPGSPERPFSQLGGLTQHANLTGPERTQLTQAGLHLDRPSLSDGWLRDDDGSPARPRAVESGEIELARARDAIRAERIQVQMTDHGTQRVVTRPEILPTATFAFNYQLAALFPWFQSSISATPAAATQHSLAENGEVIPSMLDLVAMEPLLLTYELDELLGDEVTTLSAEALRATRR